MRRAKLWVAVTNWMDHLLTKFRENRAENVLAINVLVTSLNAISDPKVAIVCESIRGKVLNGNAYKTQVRRKMTSSKRWLSRICDILWFWPQKFQKHLFCFWMNKNEHKIQNLEHFQKTVYVKQLANVHHSTKFQIDTSIFDPQKLNFFLQHNA